MGKHITNRQAAAIDARAGRLRDILVEHGVTRRTISALPAEAWRKADEIDRLRHTGSVGPLDIKVVRHVEAIMPSEPTEILDEAEIFGAFA